MSHRASQDANQQHGRGHLLDSQIESLIRRASLRLYVSDLFGRFGVTLTIVLAAMVAARASQKIIPWGLPWLEVMVGGLVLAVAAAAIWAAVRMPRGVALADEVDRRTGLRESMSTSVALAGHDDPWSRAVREDAAARVGRVVLRDSIPIRATSKGHGPLIAAVLLAAVWFVPTWDVTGLFEEKQIAQQEAEQLELVKAEVKAQDDELKKALAKAGVDFVDEPTEADELAAEGQPKKAEDIRRQAIRKLTKVTDKLDEAVNGEQAKKVEAMQQKLRQLKQPGQGPLTEFSRSLARGNFAQAKQQLEQLAQQVQSGEMSESERKQAGEQLANLAKQLEQLAEQKAELEQQLQNAGMTAEQAKQAARDPSALEKMLQDMPGIPAPQQMAMRQAAQAQQKASESMQSMASAAQQMAQACEQGGQQGQSGESGQQMAQGAQQMSGQLGSAEMAAQEAAAAQAAMQMAQQQLQQMGESMCEGGACAGSGQKPGEGKIGQFREGSSMAQGNGSGGPGRGNGVSPDEFAEDFILKNEKANVNTTGGPIIGSTVVYGAQVRGESVAQFSDAVGASVVEAAEAIETMTVPREYQDAVRHYFGRLEAAAKAAKDAPAESAPQE